MGKGDKKSRRGKIIMGSYGVNRPQNPKKAVVVEKVVKLKEEKVKAPAKPKAEPKPKPAAIEAVVENSTPIEAVKKATKKPAAIEAVVENSPPVEAVKKATKKPAAKKAKE